MFYDKFVFLCKEKGVAPTRAALDIGLSKSAPIKWRTTGATPNGETLNKIAEYFSVSVSVLLGEETKKAPNPEGEREITMDDFTYAFYKESKDLPDEKKKMLLDMARFMKSDIEKGKG